MGSEVRRSRVFLCPEHAIPGPAPPVPPLSDKASAAAWSMGSVGGRGGRRAPKNFFRVPIGGVALLEPAQQMTLLEMMHVYETIIGWHVVPRPLPTAQQFVGYKDGTRSVPAFRGRAQFLLQFRNAVDGKHTGGTGGGTGAAGEGEGSRSTRSSIRNRRSSRSSKPSSKPSSKARKTAAFTGHEPLGAAQWWVDGDLLGNLTLQHAAAGFTINEPSFEEHPDDEDGETFDGQTSANEWRNRARGAAQTADDVLMEEARRLSHYESTVRALLGFKSVEGASEENDAEPDERASVTEGGVGGGGHETVRGRRGGGKGKGGSVKGDTTTKIAGGKAKQAKRAPRVAPAAADDVIEESGKGAKKDAKTSKGVTGGKRKKTGAASVAVAAGAGTTVTEADDDFDQPCSICGIKDSHADNQIIFCEGTVGGDTCKVAVHELCYGVRVAELDVDAAWTCHRCDAKANPLTTVCAGCGKGGAADAMRPLGTTKHRRWYHLGECFIEAQATTKAAVKPKQQVKTRVKPKNPQTKSKDTKGTQAATGTDETKGSKSTKGSKGTSAAKPTAGKGGVGKGGAKGKARQSARGAAPRVEEGDIDDLSDSDSDGSGVLSDSSDETYVAIQDASTGAKRRLLKRLHDMRKDDVEGGGGGEGGRSEQGAKGAKAAKAANPTKKAANLAKGVKEVKATKDSRGRRVRDAGGEAEEEGRDGSRESRSKRSRGGEVREKRTLDGGKSSGKEGRKRRTASSPEAQRGQRGRRSGFVVEAEKDEQEDEEEEGDREREEEEDDEEGGEEGDDCDVDSDVERRRKKKKRKKEKKQKKKRERDLKRKKLKDESGEEGSTDAVNDIGGVATEGQDMGTDSTPASCEIQTGPWSKTEHATFICCLKLYGENWARASDKLASRTESQIEEHAREYVERTFAFRRCAWGPTRSKFAFHLRHHIN